MKIEESTISRFQIGLVERDATGATFVYLCACLIEASNAITQVLFFKLKDAHARFRANTAKVSLNSDSLTNLAVAIRTKTQAYQRDYVTSILDVLSDSDQQQLSASATPQN